MTIREHRQDGREHKAENTIKQTNWGKREGETQTNKEGSLINGKQVYTEKGREGDKGRKWKVKHDKQRQIYQTMTTY